MYREPYRPSVPPEVARAQAELAEYEAKMMKAARRKRTVFALAVAGVCVVCLGTCVGPLGYGIAREEWDNRKTKLTKAEQKQVEAKLARVEADVKKSQAAFDALWPKIRDREIGARHDLGQCRFDVPGPILEHKDDDDSLSLGDSSSSRGWTFIDLTPPDKRSPIATLKMPRGSIKVNNSGDRYVLPPAPLRTATAEKAPILDSDSVAVEAAKLREEAAKPIRHDQHDDFMERVDRFASHALPLEVIVFLDQWEDPSFTGEIEKEPEPKRKKGADAWGFEPKPATPVRVFNAGVAIGRAFAWDPAKPDVVCAAQGLAMSSDDITFRSSDMSPLQQDLVLQLERRLQRSFVAVGAAPPKVERP